MAKDMFKLPPVSPLLGSTLRVFRETLRGNHIDPQFKTKKYITTAVIYLISPFRWFERLFYLPRARKQKLHEVVFIVGHWRGGTTYLHNLMCQAENATFVSTYQTVFPSFMGSKRLFGPIMKAIMPDKRPSDNVKLAVDLPQEEEFAIGSVNPFSYYRFMFFPKKYKRYYAESTRFEGLSESEQKTFKSDYDDILHKAFLNKPGKLMIVKNPVNTARIKFLHEAYPNAKWIHIYRNPYTVFRSTMKFYSQLLPTIWFEEVSNDFIQSMILETYVQLYRDYDEALADIPDLDLVQLKFEDFEKDPVGNLKSVYENLGLHGFEESRSLFEQYVKSQKSHKKNTYEMPVELVKLIDEHWRKYIERWGYEAPSSKSDL